MYLILNAYIELYKAIGYNIEKEKIMHKDEQEKRCQELVFNIKGYLGFTGNTVTTLAEKLSAKNNKEISVQSLSQKINRGLMPYIEVQEIADLLGYNIEWVKRK